MGFQFETGPSEGTNRAAPASHCEMCQGDRFVPVLVDGPKVATHLEEQIYDQAYMRCPLCNAPGGIEKQPVDTDSWWKGDA